MNWCCSAHAAAQAAHLRFCTCLSASDDMCCIACTVTSMQELHRCFPSALVLQDLGSNHFPNIAFACFLPQPMQNHKSLSVFAQSLQTRSRGCFHANFENSSSGFVVLHRKHSSCSGRTHVLQKRLFGCVHARFENSSWGLAALHLKHSNCSGRTHVLQKRFCGDLHAYSENSSLGLTFLFSLLFNISSECHPGPLQMNFWYSKQVKMNPIGRLGTSKEPSRQPKYEPSGAKDHQKEQGVVHSQARVFKDDPNILKVSSRVPQTRKNHTKQSETQPSFDSCASQTPRIQLPFGDITHRIVIRTRWQCHRMSRRPCLRTQEIHINLFESTTCQ